MRQGRRIEFVEDVTFFLIFKGVGGLALLRPKSLLEIIVFTFHCKQKNCVLIIFKCAYLLSSEKSEIVISLILLMGGRG